MLTFLQELRKARFRNLSRPASPAGRALSADFAARLARCASQKCAVGIVGGSDLAKISEQLGADGARLAGAVPLRPWVV